MDFNSKKTIRSFCELPLIKAKIASDGRVSMCCHQSHEGFLGNLFEKTFEEIWFGSLAEEIRNSVKNAQLHRVCDTIECPFKYKKTLDHMHNYEVDSRGYPTHLEFDLHGSHCNFGGTELLENKICIMCPRSRADFKDHLRDMPDRTAELINKIKHLVNRLEIINIIGIAEPFWKDKIFDVLEKMNIKENKKNLEIWTTSNASVFNEERQNKLLDLSNRTDIHFSLDAATRETFLKIRKNDFFDVCCKNIKSWTKKIKETNNINEKKHYVRLHNNINMINVNEVEKMVFLAKDLEVDILVLLPTHDCGGTHKNLNNILVNTTNYHLFLEAQKKAEAAAKKIEQKIIFSRPLDLNISSSQKKLLL
jgi:MoaA/NifB/PqqE/SkfB family radical SAM enzyme